MDTHTAKGVGVGGGCMCVVGGVRGRLSRVGT